MQAKTLLLIFILLSTLLIALSIFFAVPPRYQQKIEEIRVANIQQIFYKSYKKRRDIHTIERSIEQAQEEINRILKDYTSKEKYHHLIEILPILNNTKEKFVLKIEVHATKRGSKRELLKSSKREAKEIKEFIKDRSNILFISSIGYGNRLIKKNRSLNQPIKFILQRLKQQ
jgi:Skp family chaperone for outer membrane proteins